ncbi:MAG TPA: SDR family oxidoreductase [Devosiaceae bacterium]|nr:SDR family oxidoreductase [Devosiaceae bacterium]
MNVFFFGMGFSSQAAARALHGLGEADMPIAGTVRTSEQARLFAKTPFSMHVFDGHSLGAALAEDLGKATHVVVSIPPGEGADPVLGHYADSLAAAPNLEWLCYFSTVGVYGDFAGMLIDESAPTRPVNPRSQHRVVIEQQWRDLAHRRGVPLLILRLAGIYGPGRSTFDKLRDGTARRIVKPGQVFNRIHVEDIGRITALAALKGLGGTFNLADDEPAPPQDVVAHAAGLLGIEPPLEIPFELAEMTPMARSFYADNKRVSNAAIKRALGIELLYPSYREGLAAILAAETGAEL